MERTKHLIDNFLGSNPHRSQITRRTYRRFIEEAESYLGVPFTDITEKMASSYKNYLLSLVKQNKMHKSYVADKLSVLSMFGQYLLLNLEGYDQDVFRSLTLDSTARRTKLNLNRIPSIKECDQILSAFSVDSKEFLIFSLALRCACDTSTLCMLKSSCFYEENSQLYCTVNNNRTTRVFSVPDDIRPIIDLKLSQGGYFFVTSKGTPYAERTMRLYIRNTLDSIGFSYTLEDLKSRCIIEMMAGGATDESISEYTGISRYQLLYYKDALKKTISIQPSELSRIRIMCYKKAENSFLGGNDID